MSSAEDEDAKPAAGPVGEDEAGPQSHERKLHALLQEMNSKEGGCVCKGTTGKVKECSGIRSLVFAVEELDVDGDDGTGNEEPDEDGGTTEPSGSTTEPSGSEPSGPTTEAGNATSSAHRRRTYEEVEPVLKMVVLFSRELHSAKKTQSAAPFVCLLSNFVPWPNNNGTPYFAAIGHQWARPFCFGCLKRMAAGCGVAAKDQMVEYADQFSRRWLEINVEKRMTSKKAVTN